MRRAFMLILVSVLLLPRVAVAQESDTTGPALVAFDFNPKSVDTTAGTQSISVTMHVSDDLSGVTSACAWFRNPRDVVQFACGTLVSGTTLDGVWNKAITISPFAASGTWVVERVQLNDAAGNVATLLQSDLAARGFSTDLTVISDQDITPPQIKSFAISPASVDVSSGPATITVTIAASDDRTGVNLGSRCFLYLALVLVGPSGSQPREIGCWGMTRIGGSDMDGVWTGTFIMPQYSESGTWKVNGLRVEDDARNASVQFGMTPLQVTSAVSDTTAPQLTNISFTPAVVDTSSGPAGITVDVTVTDDLSGAALENPGLAFLSSAVGFRSPSGAQFTNTGGSMQLAGGTRLNGIWRSRATFPQFAESGTWRVSIVALKDVVGNRSNLRTEDLEAAGLPAAIIVIRPSLQSDGVLTASGGTVSDSAFGARAQITAPSGVLGANTAVAIDVFSSPLDVPMPTGYTGAGTYFVNIHLTPTPAFPLPPPGLIVVLPLREPMLPGERIDLYRIDPATGQLVAALDTAGQPIRGTVDASGNSATFTGISRLSTVVGLVPSPAPVAIAVHPFPWKPEELPVIRLRGSQAVPVAILSTATFDALNEVNRSSLTFGQTGDEPSLRDCIPGKVDVNHDGLRDLLCNFVTERTNFRRGDTTGILRGRTMGRVRIEGTASIRVDE